MSSVAPAARTFLPVGLVVENWNSVASYFEELHDRKIASRHELERWLKDLSEVEAVLSEEGAWRYIRMTLDTRDTDVNARYTAFVTNVLPEVEQWSDKLHRKLMAVPFVKELNGAGYPVYLRGIREQLTIFREANVPLQAELRNMAQEYGTLMGAMNVQWKGETLTLPKAGAMLESTDRTEREAIYRAIAERRGEDTEKLDDLFTKMVLKRQTVAANAGFANFRDYMYSALGRFDHTPDDAVAFHTSVEQVVVPIMDQLATERKTKLGVDRLRPWDLSVDPEGRAPLRPFKNPDQLADLAISVFEKLDPYFANCLRNMRTNDRLDLGSREGKAPGGYNYPLYETGAPFIFMNAVGTTNDVITMVHEGGHAVHSFLTHPLPITGFKNFPSEVAELASMSMELLTMEHWHLIYTDPVDLARAKRDQLERVLSILPWVATIDAFQHAIYLNPVWTVEQRTAEWLRIHSRFGGKVVDWSGLQGVRSALWHKQLHVFEVPFYYIEYAIAQLGAVGVWMNYKKDPKKALEQYTAALKLGYTKPLPEIYATAGVSFDLSPKNVSALIGAVKAELDKI